MTEMARAVPSMTVGSSQHRPVDRHRSDAIGAPALSPAYTGQEVQDSAGKGLRFLVPRPDVGGVSYWTEVDQIGAGA